MENLGRTRGMVKVAKLKWDRNSIEKQKTMGGEGQKGDKQGRNGERYQESGDQGNGIEKIKGRSGFGYKTRRDDAVEGRGISLLLCTNQNSVTHTQYAKESISRSSSKCDWWWSWWGGTPTYLGSRSGPEAEKKQELGFEGWDRTEKRFLP